MISEAGDQASIAQFGWIPSSLLAALTRRDVTIELRAQITTVFKAQILPLPAVDQVDEQAWTDRLLVVYCHLDEGGRKALERLTGLKGYSRFVIRHLTTEDVA
jgi:sister-chromatid-cohesion protein PDS5